MQNKSLSESKGKFIQFLQIFCYPNKKYEMPKVIKMLKACANKKA